MLSVVKKQNKRAHIPDMHFTVRHQLQGRRMKMRKKIFPTLIILTSALLVVSCCMIISIIAQSNAQIDAFEELADIVQPTTEATDSEVPDETNPNL